MENISTKQKLVLAASEIIRQEGLGGISARRIAAGAGCTTTLIYKYFRNLDYLTTLGCFPFLDAYNTRVSRIEALTEDTLSRYRMSWGAFIREAFVNPRIYEWIFWGKGKALYEEAAKEYQALFPEQLEVENTAMYLAATFSSEPTERDLIWLHRMEAVLDRESLVYIGRVNSYTVHGMLAEYLRGEFSAEKGMQLAAETITRTIDSCVELKKLRKAAVGTH